MKVNIRIETDNDLIVDITDVWHDGIDPNKVKVFINRVLRCFYLENSTEDPNDLSC